MRALATLCVLIALGVAPAQAGYETELISVYDGDTFKVRVEIWPSVFIETSIRVRGIDTPEIRGKCRQEKRMALAAKRLAEKLLKDGFQVERPGHGKYARRFLGDVRLANGRSYAEVLIGNGYARRYDGGAREGWCQ